MTRRVSSLREEPAILEMAIRFFQRHWADERSMMVYDDCLRHTPPSPGPLPQWYLLLEDGRPIGGAGLVTNDFISRGDLWPWLVALYIEEGYRGQGLATLLIERARQDAAAGGFPDVYLATDHIGYYERHGFTFIGTGYHPWGESSRIYRAPTRPAATQPG